MSGQLILDWPALTLSLFNAFLLSWLGFTIILEADRRALGVWLSAEGLFLGAAFFIAHTAILRNGWQWDNPMLDFWWRAGWWPLVLSPFAWYCVILWYSGFFDDPVSPLHRRQAIWFGLILVSTAGLLIWMLLANPLPDLGGQTFNFSAFLALVISFPVYIIACIILSLDAILRPGPTARFLGNEARRQARPWLTASTLVLLLVCLLVTFTLIWGFQTFTTDYGRNVVTVSSFIPLTGLDVVIELLITFAILLIGQAAVVYEVFSSNPLPRDGLRKHWTFAIWVGGFFSIVFSSVLFYFSRPELAYLLFIPFMAGVMTFQNHQTGKDRETESRQLRTLASPLQTYDRIFSDPGSLNNSENLLIEFDQICSDLLRTNKAILVPAGVLSSFLPADISFPRDKADISVALRSPQYDPDMPIPIRLNPDENKNFSWAVPLVSTRGLDGWFYFSAKPGSGFYTIEEIEIAQAAVERWMDNQAAAEIARRLVNLRRQKLAETRLLDQKARRILHDDVLPILHTALLAAPHSESAAQITTAHKMISRLLRDAPPPPPVAITRNGLMAALKQTAESEAEILQSRLVFNSNEEVDRKTSQISADAAETVFYAFRECLRNIKKHSGRISNDTLTIITRIESGTILQIDIENRQIAAGSSDDEELRSSGQGLALHNAMLAVFGGGMRIEHTNTGLVRTTINLPVF
ncbi:MAG: hypothetical protein GX577_02290 [Leptolinea sp.]|nr:hypothetical protein [Leptolinea sp.]